MSTMITEVYDALIAAGAPEDKAKAAATAPLADFYSRFNRIDRDLMLVKWMLGLVVVVQIIPILKNLL